MLSRFALFTALALGAVPALAQPPATAPSGGATAAPAQPQYQPPPEDVSAIQQAAQAFGTCVQTGVVGVPATMTPDAGASSVLAGCASQLQSLRQAAETMIGHMPENMRAAAHAQLEGQLSVVPVQVAAGITQQRAAAAAQPAAPATTPTPH